MQISLILCFLKYIGQAADFTSTERLNKLAAFQRKALAHALSCKFVSLPDVASWFLFSINSKDSTIQLLIICEYFNDINGCVYHSCQFRMLRELFTAHALSTKLKMKMLLNLFYHLLHPMVFNWKLPSQNGTAVVSRLSRAVSKFLNLHKYVDKNDQIFTFHCFLVSQLNACFGLIPRRTKKASSLLCLSGGALGINQRNLTPTDTLTELRRQREVMGELISICLKCLQMRI